jgi:ATP-binding cassette subfamily C protein
MRLLLIFARAYPRRSLIMAVCLLFSAIAEGVGLSSLLPLLGVATRMGTSGVPLGTAEQGHSRLEDVVVDALAALGLQPTIGVLLLFIVCGIALKAALSLLAQKQIGYTVAQVATDLRLALIRALLAARWEYYVRQPVGALANSFSTEASRAAQAYLHGATIVMLAIQAVLYVSLAAAVSWRVMVGAVMMGAMIGYGLRYLVSLEQGNAQGVPGTSGGRLPGRRFVCGVDLLGVAAGLVNLARGAVCSVVSLPE